MSTKFQIILLGFILAGGLGLRLYSGLTTLPLRDAQTYLLCAEDYRLHGDFSRAFASAAIDPQCQSQLGYDAQVNAISAWILCQLKEDNI